ncbi:MAG: NAD(P)/FAD-dependent oxidoreductase [Actinomycetota bacterium]
MYDLIVAGGGPAGLATALYATRAGLDAVVLDPRPPPIDKACGEGLMPGAVTALDDLGVHPDGHDIRGIRYADGAHRVEALFRTRLGRGVRRTDLHAALLDAVRASGVPVLSRSVGDLAQDERRVRVSGLEARYLAAADGLHSPLRRQLGLDIAPRPGTRPRWGLRQHFAVPPWTDFVEVHWTTDAEVYVTPVGPDLVGVAVLSGIRAPYAAQLAGFPAVLARLPSAGATSVRGAGPMRQRVRRRVAGRVLLVGDAAGYVDALTGEGIAVALACGRALVDCVVRDEPRRYERQWLRASRRYRLITESLIWARERHHLQPMIVPAAKRAPWLFAAAISQLAR